MAMKWNFTETEVAIFASLVFILIVLFQFFIQIMMPPNDKHPK
ncbi:hypothetical protein [Tumebacillus flagellatus]|nr:hypothetical protein [Tumebacillus flagellatus]